MLPMLRVLLIAALVAATGCQTQNPFAAIGPNTVPAPTTGQPLPYYPPTVTGAGPGAANAPPAATVARPARLSVSAEGTASAAAPPSAIVADAADREQVRIVESNAPAARTANAAARGNPAPGIQPAPAAGTPSGQIQPPSNRVPVTPGGNSGYAPPGASPATSRMRGFAAAPSTTNEAKTVAPASYQQMTPTFSEATPADGQWRAR